VEPSAIVSTTKLQPGEPDELEEGDNIFHSHMWIKGTLLHFIVDRGRHHNLILSEIIKQLTLPTTPHLHPYTFRWLYQGSDLHASQ
jgi:hypothetical protein